MVARIALFAAVLLQALIAATAAQAYACAESVAILLATVLAWGFSGGELTEAGLASVKRWRRGSVLPCLLLTCLALTPFLRSALQSVGFRQVVLAGVAPPALRKVVPGAAYTGFILTGATAAEASSHRPASYVFCFGIRLTQGAGHSL